MAVSNGNPTLSVVLNNSGGPGGSFDVNSGGSTYFSVSETGVVTVSEKITRHSATPMILEVNNLSPSDLLYLNGSGTTRIEFKHDSVNGFARMKASTASYHFRVEGESIQLNANASSGTGTIGDFMMGGTSRATIEWDSSLTRAVLKATTDLLVNANGSTKTLYLTGGRDTVVKANEVLYLHFGGGSGTDKDLVIKRTDTSSVDWDVVRLSEGGVMQFFNGSDANLRGSIQATDANVDNVLELGIYGPTRGKVLVHRDNTGGALRPGVVVLEPQDTTTGVKLYLYAYYDPAAPAGQRNQLRCNNADPAANNVGKVVVSF